MGDLPGVKQFVLRSGVRQSSISFDVKGKRTSCVVPSDWNSFGLRGWCWEMGRHHVETTVRKRLGATATTKQ